MTDYTKSTGSSGTMMIRDVGDGWVEFWLKAGSATFNHDLPWAYIANGTSSSWQTFDFVSGGAWQKIAWFWVTYSQNITFKLGNTGTSGLGGPTDFTQWISRATVPSAPNTPVISNIGATALDVNFTDGSSNGGASIDQRQIGYGTDPWNAQAYATANSSGFVTISGLVTGTTYYFWARTHNSVGYSNWSGRATATTDRIPDAPSTPVISNVLPTSVVATYSPNGDGGAAITGYDVGYSTSPGSPTTIVPGTSPQTIIGLTPGTTYYFWARAKNAVGNGPWSASSSVRTIAGAYIKVGAEYKLAVPYVKVSGVWTLAQPYVRSAGVWKQTV